MEVVRETRWVKRRQAVENWKMANYQYYLEQKRRLAHRPAYLAHRREMYAAKRVRPLVQIQSLSTQVNDEKTFETTDR